MKYLSGDFMFQYNKILEEYVERQKKLDLEIDQRMAEIITSEKDRLKSNNKFYFSPGDKVKIVGEESEGIVKKSEIYFNPLRDDEDQPLLSHGPQRYYKIENLKDEEIVTCEGMFQNVFVQMKKTFLHEDWGVEGEVVEFFEDEIERID